jgi:hypothetical protein
MYPATMIRIFCLTLTSALFAVTCFAAMPDPAVIGPRTEPVNLGDYKQVYYVSASTGDDEQGNGTREKPWKSVVHALDRISGAGEANPAAVLVAEGTYDQNTVVMKAFVSLFGGYSKEVRPFRRRGPARGYRCGQCPTRRLHHLRRADTPVRRGHSV